MIDVYRTPAKPFPPVACMYCMTTAWMTYDVFVGHWFCRVCGECDCDWAAAQERIKLVVP